MIEKTRSERVSAIVVSITAIAFFIWSGVFIYCSSFIAIDGQRYFSLFDDAMISMRYGWNLSHGYGLVMNPGEYVEGYSNLLMTLVMAGATSVLDKAQAVLAIQIFGVITVLACALVTTRIYDAVETQDSYRQLGRWLCFVCVLCYYPLVYWSLMGMEIGLVALFVAGAILSVLYYVKQQKAVFLVIASVCMGLAFLTRNDSAIYVPALYGFVLYSGWTNKRLELTLRHLIVPLGIYGIFVVGNVVWRLGYYGELVPNTYILKMMGIPLLLRLENGWSFIRPFLGQSWLLFGLVLVGLVIRFRAVKLFLALFPLLAIGYHLYIGGDAWDYWRLMVPAMPALFVLVVLAIGDISEWVYRTSAARRGETRAGGAVWKSRFALVLAAMITLSVPVSVNNRFRGEIVFQRAPYQVLENHENVNTALALNAITGPEATVGVIWAGIIPYYTGKRMIDFLGKADRYIAHLAPDLDTNMAWYGMTTVPGHNKYDLHYSIQKRKPTFVQKFQWGRHDLTEWSKSNYVQAEYLGVPLALLKDSPEVQWELVQIK